MNVPKRPFRRDRLMVGCVAGRTLTWHRHGSGTVSPPANIVAGTRLLVCSGLLRLAW